MNRFNELILHATSFTLEALEQANAKISNSLQHNASTSLVKGLQMIQLQKAIIAIGMFSLFETELQSELSCSNGFKQALKLLDEKGKNVLKKRFNYFILAINVLKHGKGKSYNALVAEYKSLPFKIKLPEENFFDEGDVSEISTLIYADDIFVLNCAELITDVYKVIRKS